MIRTPKLRLLAPHLPLPLQLPQLLVQLRTNDLGAVVLDARNADRNVMNSDQVVGDVLLLMRNVFMKLSFGGVGERLISLGLVLAFLMLVLPRTR